MKHKEYTTEEIREKIESIVDPGNGKTLKDAKSIKHVGVNPDTDVVILIVVITKTKGLEEKAIKREIAKRLKLEMGFSGVKVQFEERRIIESVVKRDVKFIIVASGKGGVGKSTVACNIAYSLKKMGKNVGIIDADIYGSSIPQILEMEHQYPNASESGKIIPFEAYGMEVISTEFFAEPGRAVIWRGAMLNSMMENFFYEVMWRKDLDYMIIDCPPGTGDISLDLGQIVPNALVLIVTTPHKAASHVATKAGYASQKIGHKVIGVIENMSYYINPVNKEKEFIFGSGGGELVAQNLNTELLAQIPITQPKHHLSLFESDEEAGKIYDDLATIISIQE